MMRAGLFAVASLFALAACAFADNQGIHPALYVVRDRDSTLYLYGSVHVRPNGADWGNADVRAAIDEASEIWTELEISPAAEVEQQALVQRLGAAPPGQPLSSWLSVQENEQLTALTRRLGIPRAALEGLRPSYAAMTLALVPILRAGYDPNSGVDRAVDAYGDAHGKTMRAFETAEDQLGFLANLSPDLQREMLREAIEENEAGPAEMVELTRAWERGDVPALERLVIDETRNAYPELYETLFVRRNAAWITILSRELNGAGVDFVAVGAGHLLGPDGLVAQLESRGYRVERVNG